MDADFPELLDYASRIMGRVDRVIHRIRPVAPAVAPYKKAASRMPSAVVAQAMYQRDGWRCRFCGCSIVVAGARTVLRAHLPEVIPWGETKGVYHGGLYALAGVPDHVVPHAHGGDSDLDNIVTACWPCNFGRGSLRLEEVGLSDPRSRSPVVDAWDGLNRLVALRASPAKKKSEINVKLQPARLVERKLVTSAKNEAAWTNAIERIAPGSTQQLRSFADKCAQFGVTYAIEKVMIFRMRVGSSFIQPFGIEANGDVSAPWLLGKYKSEFKHFAHTIADAIPGAIATESPTQWRIKTPIRPINVREFLDAQDTIYEAFREVREKLDRS